MIDCPQCGGTGYRSEKRGDYWYSIPCTHGREGETPAGGFTGIESFGDRVIERLQTNGPEMVEAALGRHLGDLSAEEIQIARLIGRRVGQASAIRIADIIQALGGGWTDRDIKGMVERLRTIPKLPIAATKAPPYGYFVPATDQEMKDMHDRHFREGIKQIIISQLFGTDKDLAQKLQGQLELEAR
jgi:hypothetical protein